MSKKEKTIIDLINEAREQKSKILNLLNSEDYLDEIPDELYDLEDLNELHFGNRIKKIDFSNKICNLKNLVELSIFNDDLDEIPQELIKLNSLKKFSIRSTKLVKLTKHLNEWATLEYLNLGNCSALKEVHGLPPNLTYIYLNGASFEHFPEEVYKLKNLVKLVASDFRLDFIPKEIFELKELCALFLGDNNLTEIPIEILKLEHLSNLWLDNNRFTELPKIVYQLKGLTDLNLRNNYLSNFTTEFSDLVNLNSLDLGGNDFAEIPNVIFELPNLKELNFSSFNVDEIVEKKRIKIIPNEILKLEKLKKISLSGHTIENVPPEIVNEGIEAIKNFILSKLEADKEDFLYEAKMVVVGRGDVGKTVLTKKLTNPNYSLSKSKSTKGISILKNPFDLQIENSENVFKFNIWDFGGQEKYDATHQLFITSRSIYLFLTEARDESNYQDVYYWLNTINLFSDNSPVIIILCKYDERKKLLPESVYKEKFQNIVQFVDVSCADGFEYTIENLKSAIKDSIKLLPQTKLTLSNHWIDIRNNLEKLSSHVDFIPYNEYLEICQANKLDKERADFLSEYLNDLGVIIHHKNDLLLKNTVFVNTDWCVDGMYKVLDDDLVFQNKGKFTDNDLEVIWKDKRFKDKQAELIRLMCDYGLCFRLLDGTGYIAPDLLPLDKPIDLTWRYESSLQFEYQYTFMPAGMISRFIVKSHSFIKDSLFWKYGVVLQYDSTLAIIEEDYIHSKIKISLKGENKKGLLSAIKMFMGEVHKDFDKSNKLSFQEMIPCNCQECAKSETPHFYKYNVLRKFEQKSKIEILCDNSCESVKIKELINDVVIPNPTEYFETNCDLRNFIMNILNDVLEKEVMLKEGFTCFWRDIKCENPKDEVEVQPYICNVIDNYCKVRGVNLSREAKAANGNVDILFSCTNKYEQTLRVCLEIKKAHHADVTTAIETQLPPYLQSTDTECGIYLVLWFKNDVFTKPNKFNSTEELYKSIKSNNKDQQNISIKIIDCTKQQSPSKIRI